MPVDPVSQDGNNKEAVDANVPGNAHQAVSNVPVTIGHPVQHYVSVDSLLAGNLPSLQLPVIKNDQLKSPGNLRLGFVLAVGASSRTDKPLQIGASKEKNYTSSFFADPVAGGNFSGGVLILPPSEVKPGAAFKAGVVAMKPLSKRFDFSAGLIYSYSSDHIQIGKQVYSSVSYFNNATLDIRAQTSAVGATTTNYTNRYHFIELPLSGYYNLTGKWKTPLVWNAGISISRLISSNVLLYDEALGGVYYDGSRNINKTQFNFSTGFSFPFFR